MAEEKVNIRPIEKQDNRAIYRLIREILVSYNLDRQGTAYYDPYLKNLYENYKNLPKAQYWILTKDDQVYGGAGIGPFGEYEKIAEIQKYYIHKDIQGLGYGRQLYDVLMNYAIDQGYEKLYIETSDVLSKANEIYKHYGFEHLKEPLKGTEHPLMNTWFMKDIECNQS